MRQKAATLLKAMLGPRAEFRPGQWESIEQIAIRRQRLLLVQRTGWGKSLVYFVATRLLRDAGRGPTLLVSPLLSLMRNQVAMAAKIGIRAVSINSTNRSEWEAIESSIQEDSVDVVLVSPERLANSRFQDQVMGMLGDRLGMLVIDEAHCISDWGHDFRPDYRRIVRLVDRLPRGTPVLATTATANDRVVEDVRTQLGEGLAVHRGPLVRTSLRLQNLIIPDQASRMAWLAEKVPLFPGSGVIYCLTVADARRVAAWLRHRGIEAEPYHAGDDSTIDRVALEEALVENRVKALVATVALGMGFDKPDLGFVIHFQRPGSVVAYYQQVGRAGRALDRAYGILLSGVEDDEIQDYFITSAFPTGETMRCVLEATQKPGGAARGAIGDSVNASWTMIERSLKLLEIDEAVRYDVDARTYICQDPNWTPDLERIERVQAQRLAELKQMQDYVDHPGCLMEFLARALDDPAAAACSRCANCQRRGFTTVVDRSLAAAAIDFIKGEAIEIDPRSRAPMGALSDNTIIPEVCRNETGRVLSYYADAGWGSLVKSGKYGRGRFDDDLVAAAAELVRGRWRPEPSPEWITAIPSRRHPKLVYDFAERLALTLDLEFLAVLTRPVDHPEQKDMANSTMQARNVLGTLEVTTTPRTGPVLLVDDIVDSGWTMTVAGWLLRRAGSGTVYPFALARATGRVRT